MRDGKKAAAVGVGLGLAGLAVYALTREVKAAPPGVIYCPYCGAGPFSSLDEVNEHILAAHPDRRLLTHIVWK